MREKITYNLNNNGKIVGFKWTVDNPKAIIVISHGMAEHIERYEMFANFMNENKYSVYGHNHRGHKLTSPEESYGYMSDEDNLGALVLDLYEIISIIKKDNPNIPIYLLGHSMGSFVSQRVCQLYPDLVDKLVLCGSTLQRTSRAKFGRIIAKTIMIFKGRRYKSKLLDKLSFGSYNKIFKPNRTECDWLNQEEAEVDKYIEDKWCGGIFSCSFFYDFTNLFLKINKNFSKISQNLPILIISGTMDPVGECSKGTTNLYKIMKKNNLNVEMKLYENARHELLLERCHNEVYTDIKNFLDK